MRIALSSDEVTGVAADLAPALEGRGHEVLSFGALAPGGGAGGGYEDARWAWASERAAREVAEGRAELAVVCCWTGTGASIAANKVPGVRAALCHDAFTAAGARRWTDANVLALSLRSTSKAELEEILDGFLATPPSAEREDLDNIEHLGQI
ncbi:MAG: RpiB/LacA/LacB family sugar-phosphate isomerase, partial [Acidobacteriota bacterium]|nr:RpiB/LacA/LacB family sugar-phosphate isomerase [Acidobacteriota bacterium]